MPALLMAIWVGKNLLAFGTPLYGSAYGFLPAATPVGPGRGVAQIAAHFWQLSPLLTILGVPGIGLEFRRARLLGCLVALGLVVPWYTVSFFRIEVAFRSA